MAELALLAAVLLMAASARLIGLYPAVRATVIAVNFGFAFWYWLPALNVVLIHYLGDGSLPVAAWAVTRAAWIVLGYHAAALAGAGGAGLAFRRLREPAAGAPLSPPLRLAVAVLASSVVLVFVRFGDPLLALRILGGLDPARDHMTFFNRSASVGESLLKLWEILNLWTALFVLGWAAARRALLGAASVLALAAIVIGFVGAGSRVDLLMAVFVVAAGLAGRTSASRRTTGRRTLVPMTAIALLGGLAAVALAARFRTGPGPLHAAVNSLLVNNDMFSETAFVLMKFPGFDGGRAGDFLATPFSFLMPHFLGFTRAIPDHLVQFNRVRAGIDLLHGQGNVFPGIAGDFVMVFGALPGMAVFAGAMLVFTAALAALARSIPAAAPRLAYALACNGFLVASIRNTQGSLALVMLFGLGLAWACAMTAQRR